MAPTTPAAKAPKTPSTSSANKVTKSKGKNAVAPDIEARINSLAAPNAPSNINGTFTGRAFIAGAVLFGGARQSDVCKLMGVSSGGICVTLQKIQSRAKELDTAVWDPAVYDAAATKATPSKPRATPKKKEKAGAVKAAKAEVKGEEQDSEGEDEQMGADLDMEEGAIMEFLAA